MCGIAGFFDLKDRTQREENAHITARQIAVQRYRGPDSAGVWNGPGLALGHARLAIIDVTSAADQPFFDASGQVALVFNGEIYNFQEIREELIARGRKFRSHSDTEVIAEGYAEWGVDVVDRLRGMFAIAIYDRRADRLVLMRDRVGKKPLHYARVGDRLVFSSEVKGVLAFPGVERRVNYDAIHEYLSFQYVPSPMTAFHGVSKLPPGHLLIAERGGTPQVRRYYSFPKPGPGVHRPIGQLCEELTAELREATRLRMIADVPLGAFLSGGVDSSSVVAMMATVSNEPVRTFTIGFEEQAYDERQYARAVAERYGTQHFEMTVRPDAMSVLPELVYHYGEPYADSSAIPTYYVSKIAREHVTVILSGDGGDESFFGYARYLLCRQKDNNRPLSRAAWAQLYRLGAMLPQGVRGMGRMRALLRRLYDPHSLRYEQAIAYFSDDSKTDLYGAGMRRFLSRSAIHRLDAYFDEAETMAAGAAWADVNTYLPDDLLVKVDIASMANSLEVRAPFLDHKLMEWAAGVPEDQRFEGDEPKSLLKKAMEPYLPHDLMYRPKMGFGVPIDHWLRREMRDFTRDTLLGPRARSRDLFDPAAVEALLARHESGENWSNRIWALLMLELWFQMWVDSADMFDNPAAHKIIRRYDGPQMMHEGAAG